MKKEKIQFKGIKDGIYLLVEDGNFNEIEEELNLKMIKSKNFFKGAKILGIKSEFLEEKEKISLMNILKYRYDLNVTDEALFLPYEKNKINESDSKQKSNKKINNYIDEGYTKFVRNTIRSGQSIDSEGNIVVIGDVNPGAVLTANGNIIILGRMKGIAHAGSDGNRDAIVAAYDLQPTQLRISNCITRKPDGQIEKDEIPEVAKIEGEGIVIKPYLLKNNK